MQLQASNSIYYLKTIFHKLLLINNSYEEEESVKNDYFQTMIFLSKSSVFYVLIFEKKYQCHIFAKCKTKALQGNCGVEFSAPQHQPNCWHKCLEIINNIKYYQLNLNSQMASLVSSKTSKYNKSSRIMSKSR